MDVLILAPSKKGGGTEKQIDYIYNNMKEYNIGILYFSEGNNKILTMLKCFFSMIYFCIRYKKLVVYSFLTKENLLNLYICRMLFRKKCIISLRNSPYLLLDFPSSNKLKNKITTILLKMEIKNAHKADKLISNSETSLNEIKELNQKINNGIVIENGIEIMNMENITRNGIKNVYYIARIDNQGVKNHSEFIEIAKYFPNINFHIGGTGVMNKFSSTINLENLIIHDHVSDIKSFLKDKDVLLNVSLSEGSPNLIIEAMQYNILCISRPCGDVPLLFEGTQNKIYNSVDDAISIIESFQYKEYTIDTNKKISQKYNIDKMINKNLEIIGSLGS